MKNIVSRLILKYQCKIPLLAISYKNEGFLKIPIKPDTF